MLIKIVSSKWEQLLVVVVRIHLLIVKLILLLNSFHKLLANIPKLISITKLPLSSSNSSCIHRHTPQQRKLKMLTSSHKPMRQRQLKTIINNNNNNSSSNISNSQRNN